MRARVAAGCARYQAVRRAAVGGALAARVVGITWFSGASHATSAYASKCLWTTAG